MSPLLARLEAQIDQATDENLKAELRAQKAAYLARVGDFKAAQEIVSSLRAIYGDGRSGRVTCHIMIAEALLWRFESFDGRALDRLTRALFLSQAARERDLVAISSTWKAFLEFEECRFRSMRESIKVAQSVVAEDDHGVHARLAIIFVLGLQLLGDRELSRKWFDVAHWNAVQAGDRASIQALVFNRSVFGVARHRIDWALGALDRDWLSSTKSELESAMILEHLVDIQSMRGHVDLALARSEALCGDFAAARTRLEALDIDKGFKLSQINESVRSIDLALCLVRTGEVAQAKAIVGQVDLSALDKLDPDERYVALKTLDLIASEVETADIPPVDAQMLKMAETEYRAYEGEIRSALADLL